MILFYANTAKEEQARFVRYLFNSCNVQKQLVPTNKFDHNLDLFKEASTIVFAGFLRGEGLIYQHCLKEQKNFLFIDHAYLNRGYRRNDDSNEWMRVTHNSFNWASYKYEDADRWNRYFAKAYPLSKWNSNNGEKILVLPPSEAAKMLFPNSKSWIENIVEEIKKKTRAPIHIREKPLQPIVDKSNNVIGKVKYEHQNTIEQDMQEAKCIVTFNSAVPIIGTIQGIPCICSPYAAAYPMSIDVNDIDNPVEPNRQDWLNQLVHHQYTTTELKDGTFWIKHQTLTSSRF